jgi:hypothetical protein
LKGNYKKTEYNFLFHNFFLLGYFIEVKFEKMVDSPHLKSFSGNLGGGASYLENALIHSNDSIHVIVNNNEASKQILNVTQPAEFMEGDFQDQGDNVRK